MTTVQVELSDLEQVAAAIDGVVTSVDADPTPLISALELVQTYIDNAQETTTDEASDSETLGAADNSEPTDAMANEDLPF